MVTAEKVRGGVQVLLVLLVPAVLILTSIRSFLTHTFLQIEYRATWFPEDSYGFRTEDRLRFGAAALDFLFEPAASDALARLQFEDGQPLFQDRELQHMEDVRRLTQVVLRAWVGVSLLAGVCAAWLKGSAGWSYVGEALVGGARVTVLIVLGVGLLILLAFPVFFTGFHRIFFAGDTWLFAYSDTLIRLFPIRFWSDVSIGIAVVTLLFSGVAAGAGRLLVLRNG